MQFYNVDIQKNIYFKHSIVFEIFDFETRLYITMTSEKNGENILLLVYKTEDFAFLLH